MTMHGRRLRRITALLTGGALVGGALLAAPIGAVAPAAAADGTTITPNPAYAGEAFEGWGTSLVWFANATGDYPDEIREKLADMVFGDEGTCSQSRAEACAQGSTGWGTPCGVVVLSHGRCRAHR